MAERKRILIVDDDQFNLVVMDATLRSLGYDVARAQDGAEALARLAPDIDLILLDVMMPGMDGFEVTRRIRKGDSCYDVPIIMVTALTSKEDRLMAVEAGANDFISKPIDRVELTVRVRSLLKMKEAQEAVKQYGADLEILVEKRTTALRESEKRMRLLIESSPIGVAYADHSGYSYVNPALAAMFGYAFPEEIIGMPLEALCCPEDTRAFLEKAIMVAGGASGPRFLEMRGLHKEGKVLDLSVWMTPIEFGDEPGLLAFLVDVSEEKALKARILQAQKLEALGTLAGGIAHDFNNILFVITGFTELSLDTLPKGDPVHLNLARVLEAAGRAANLVKQILTFCREGQQERMFIEVGPIIKETLRFLQASVPPTIEMHQTIPKNLGTVLADPTQIHQVLMNLCTNAVHAMGKSGGTLDVEVSRMQADSSWSARHPELTPGPLLCMTVRDTGHGMSLEVLERIFEPYFTTKKQGEGTGLGLALVHGIVKSHGGVLEAESEPGKGTTFRVYLPIVCGESSRDDVKSAALPLGKESILLVDNERSLVEMAHEMLSRLGYEVTARTSALDAVELFRGEPTRFDLVVTDMTMPEMRGTELAREILCIRPDIPVILCTGFAEPVTEEQVREIGIEALLMKPVLKHQLADTIRQVLDGALQRSQISCHGFSS